VTTAVPEYISKKDHRDGTSTKSQWVITFNQEKDCFVVAWTRGWTQIARGWGLHLVEGVPVKVGVAAQNTDRAATVTLKVAIFRTDSTVWHGYPSDYRIHAQDRPSIDVLKEWTKLGFIKKHEVRKIRGGQPCSLSD
jgi:hypothetical protein